MSPSIEKIMKLRIVCVRTSFTVTYVLFVNDVEEGEYLAVDLIEQLGEHACISPQEARVLLDRADREGSIELDN